MSEKLPEKSSLAKFVSIFHNPYTAWGILVISLILTLSAAYLSFFYSRNIAEQRFLQRAGEITQAIKFRMSFYEQALWGGVGLFNSSEEVSREEFRVYVKSLEIENHLPGIQGVGYSIPVKKEQKDSLVREIRSEGFADFSIRPGGEREEYSSIIYLEPFDWRNQRAFGYDMWSNEMRRGAMTRARNTGEAATSGVITLVQETSKDVQKGFLMYLPVYGKEVPLNTVEERERAFLGWVYSPFRAGDLMHGVLSNEELEYGIEVYDGKEIKEQAMLFDSDSICHLNQPRFNPDLSKFVDLELQGRSWKLFVHSKPNILSKQEANLPIFIGVFGLVIDLVLFMVIYSLYWMQKKTKALALELEDQKEELEKVNTELSQFAYLASHDLQEPLRTVSNYATMIEEDYSDKLDEDGKEFIETILNATRRMSQLIHAILKYSQIGKLIAEPEPIDCNEMVEEIEIDMESLIAENRAKLVYEKLPEIKGDRLIIRQLFFNLISNGIKFRKKDEDPIIIIRGKEVPSGYEFSISDNGIGIEEMYQERIFKIFQRLHNKTDYEGTGIGLAFCKKIVECYNGKIEVESEVDKGSTFRFTLLNQA